MKRGFMPMEGRWPKTRSLFFLMYGILVYCVQWLILGRPNTGKHPEITASELDDTRREWFWVRFRAHHG